MQCTFVNRVAVPGVRLGGASLGQCTRDALPGMVLCGDHATREAMAHHIRCLVEKMAAQAKVIAEKHALLKIMFTVGGSDEGDCRKACIVEDHVYCRRA